MVTRLQVKYDVVNWYNQHFDEVLARMVMPLTSTATAADALGVRDTLLARGTTAANDFDRRQIEVTEQVGSGPAVGEASAVDDGGFDNTDLLTVSPAFSAALEAGADYILFGRNLSPEIVNNGISEALRGTDGPYLWFPSMVNDSGIETTALATDWPDVVAPGSTATELVTASANIMFGQQSIHGVADGAGQGWNSQAFNVHETDIVLASVYVRAAVGSVIVQLYNETASEVIKAVTIDEPAWTEVRFSESVPDDCEQMRVRILSAAASDDFYMGAPVVVQSTAGHNYVAPSWFQLSKYLEAVEIAQGFASEDSDSYAALSKSFRAASYEPEFLDEARGVNPANVWVRACNAPVALVVQRAFDDVTTNAGATNCDREYLKWKALANILEARGEDAQARGCQVRAMGRARSLGYGLRDVRMRENRLVAV